MDAKPVIDCLLGAFLFGELPRFDLFTVWNRMIFYGNFARLRCSTQIGTFNSNLFELPGGDPHTNKTGMLVGNFKLDP